MKPRKFNLLLMLVTLALQSWSQPPKATHVTDQFRNYHFEYTPGAIVSLIREEVTSLPAEQLDALEVEYESRIQTLTHFNLKDRYQRQRYYQDYLKRYGEVMRQASARVGEEDLLYYLKDYALKYGTSAANQNLYNRIPQSLDQSLRQPAINRILVQVVDTLMAVQLDARKSEVEAVVKKRISLLAAENINIVNLLPDRTAFEERIFKVDGVVVSQDDDKVFKKVFSKFAYDFVKNNETFITENFNRIDQIRDKGGRAEQDFRDSFNTLIFKAGDRVNRVNARLIAEVKNNLNASKSTYTQLLKQELDQAKSGFAVLAQNQKEMFGQVETIQQRIQDNIAVLDALSEKLNKQFSVKDLAEYTKLTNQNAFWAKVIDSYVNGKIDTKSFANTSLNSSLNLLNSEWAKQTFGEANISSYKRDLKQLMETPTFATVSAAVHYAGAGVQALQSLGILKGEDVKKAGQFLHYASAAIKIGSGIAMTLSGNPLGIIDVIGGIAGLFGGKPEPSAEMKMMQQIMEQLQAMDAKLDRIESKLDKLNENLVKVYQDLAQRIETLRQEVRAGFTSLDKQISVVQSMLAGLNMQHYNTCDAIDALLTKVRNDSGLSSFSSWADGFTNVGAVNTCKEAVETKVASTINIRNLAEIETYQSNARIHMLRQEREAYEKTLELFLTIYPNSSGKISLLSIPLNELKDLRYYSSLNTERVSTLNPGFIYPPTLYLLANRYLSYEPFMVAYANHSFLTFDAYTNLPDRSKANTLSILQQGNSNLLKVIEEGIQQQTMMAGNLLIHKIYDLLYNANDPMSTEANKKLVIEVLRKNPLLAYNFVRYIIFKDSDHIQRFNKAYLAISTTDDVAIINQNLADITKASSNVFNQSQPVATGILTTYEVSASGNNRFNIKIDFKGTSVSINVPNPFEIAMQDVTYSDDLNLLLEVKSKLLDQRMEIEMVKGISHPNTRLKPEECKYFMVMK